MPMPLVLIVTADFKNEQSQNRCSGNLLFHYFSREKFKVITWSNHGLSYALVSSLSASARESCLVCHQNMADRDVYRTRP
jgi:hypothetical protein